MDRTETLLTADDLLSHPDDGNRHELVNGELLTMAPTGSEHGAIVVRVTAQVFSYVERNGLGVTLTGEPGFKIASDPDTVRAPDLAFVRRENVPEAGIPTGYWPGAPNLAAEVVSPSDTYEQVDAKVATWLDAGTEVVWVLNPRRRTIAIHTGSAQVRVLAATDELDGGTVLPGFTCPVGGLFP
ncbi:MAG: Uma2 family endonuclease [Gemmatimonas sp.]|nr:Uma2 family endonuclease [Gemmatimonas sp.]